jgi:adenylate cyclase
VLAIFPAYEPRLSQGLRDSLFDAYQRLRPRVSTATPVRIVDIDEESLARIGQWPWPRDRLAELVHALHERGAATVVIDVLMAEPDRTSPGRLPLPRTPGSEALHEYARSLPDHDAMLSAAIAAGRVVTGFALVDVGSGAPPTSKARFAWVGADAPAVLPGARGAVGALPMLQQEAAGNGALSISLGTGGVVRQMPLLLRVGDQIHPSLAAETLRVAQGADTYVVRLSPADRAIEMVRVGAFEIPTEAAGQLWLYASGPVQERYLPAWQVLAGEEPAKVFDGAIVLIGSTARGLQDVHQTPLGHDVAGVELHAQALEQIIQERYLHRPAWATGAEVVLLLCLGGLVILFGNQRGPTATAILAGLGVLSAFGVSWAAFATQGLLLDPLPAAASVIVVYFVLSLLRHLQTEHQQRWIRKAFASYISPKLVEQLVENPAHLRLGGERREISCLFTDLEGFTALVESTPPSAVVPALNAYLDGMIRVAFDYDGTVDKIVGDAVHVIFGAPIADPRHAERAVACARDLDDFAQQFAADRRSEGLPFGGTRIGVNAGIAIVGNFGGTLRFDYTAHGDVINVAARLESANKILGTRIAVSEAVVSRCPGFVGRPAATLLLKGKSEAIRVFEPLPQEAAGSPGLARWLKAYELLEKRDPAAEAAFAALVEAWPDDRLARLHLNRLRRGETGVLVTLSQK